MADSTVFKISENNTYSSDVALPFTFLSGTSGCDSGSYSYFIMAAFGTQGGSNVNTASKKNLGSWTSAGTSGYTARAGLVGLKIGALFYTSGGANAATVSATEKGNGVSWSTFSAGVLGAHYLGKGSEIRSINTGYVLYGSTAAGANGCAFAASLNGSDSSSTITNNPISSSSGAAGTIEFQNKIYTMGGYTVFADANNSSVALTRSWNGSSWTSESDYPSSVFSQGIVSGKNRIRTFAGFLAGTGTRGNSSYEFNGTSYTSITSTSVNASEIQGGSF